MQQIILLNKADKRTPLTRIAEDLRPDDIIFRSARRSESDPRESDDGNDDDADPRAADDDAMADDGNRDQEQVEDREPQSEDHEHSDASGDSSADLQDEGSSMVTPLS